MGRTAFTVRATRARADHPHAGGENLTVAAFKPGNPGPSPRGWGERAIAAWSGCRFRTIPTRVGRTGCGLARSLRLTDHPHAGGENCSKAMSDCAVCGPSPRGWGELHPRNRWGDQGRTIPTRVGRTHRPLHVPEPAPDHPHAGGENNNQVTVSASLYGPSPRGWGEHSNGSGEATLTRTIPTRVGRTTIWSTLESLTADHPHAGGENVESMPTTLLHFGPSPRGWGERAGNASAGRGVRTIPTRVGRTTGADERARAMADHPHAGGENSRQTERGASVSGPSPRGWGELRATVPPAKRRRTIPTRVGRTCAAVVVRAGSSDHPHAGGEN